MNKIDPGLRISAKMIRETASGEKPDPAETELNPLVERIAEEFQGDTISPVMVSGYLRIGEFAGLAAIGLKSGRIVGLARVRRDAKTRC